MIISFLISFILPYMMFNCNRSDSFFDLIIVTLFSVTWSSIVIYIIALSAEERKFINKGITSIVLKLKNKSLQK